MAYVYDVNNIDLTTNLPGQYIYTLKTSLLSAGWLLKGSGNGPTGSSNNIATAGSSQATDYFTSPIVANTSGSWFRVRSPTTMSNGTFRELTFQACRFTSLNIGSQDVGVQDYGTSNNTARTYRIKYSMCISGSGFFGGTISANSGTTPSAATAGDEYIVAGSAVNTDTGSVNVSGELGGGLILNSSFNSTTYYWSTIANDEPPYDFAIFTFLKTSRNDTNIFSYSSLLQGSYETSDADPYVFLISGGNYLGRILGYNIVRAILGYGTEYQTMVELTRQTTIQIGQGHIAGEDNLLPGRFYRLSTATAPNGWKGFSTFLLDLTTYSSRQSGDTISVNSTRDKIILTDFAIGSPLSIVLPWNGSIPLT